MTNITAQASDSIDVSNMTVEDISDYLTQPATTQQVIDAMVVNSDLTADEAGAWY